MMDTVRSTDAAYFSISEHSKRFLKNITGSTSKTLTVRHLDCEQEEETGFVHNFQCTMKFSFQDESMLSESYVLAIANLFQLTKKAKDDIFAHYQNPREHLYQCLMVTHLLIT